MKRRRPTLPLSEGFEHSLGVAVQLARRDGLRHPNWRAVGAMLFIADLLFIASAFASACHAETARDWMFLAALLPFSSVPLMMHVDKLKKQFHA